MRADAVQKVPIVRNDHHRAIAFVQHAFEPADRVDIEVVRRFVEQQDIGIAEQRLREQYAQLPARRDTAHQALVLLERNADTEQQFAGARFGRVAIEFGEFHFEIGDLHTVGFAHLRQRIDPVALLLDGPESRVTHDHRIEHAEFFECELVLAQLAQPDVGLDRHIAGRRRHVAAEDFHECRLTRAVRADQTVAIAFAELDGDVFEQRLRAELNREIGCGDHGSSSMEMMGLRLARDPRRLAGARAGALLSLSPRQRQQIPLHRLKLLPIGFTGSAASHRRSSPASVHADGGNSRRPPAAVRAMPARNRVRRTTCIAA